MLQIAATIVGAAVVVIVPIPAVLPLLVVPIPEAGQGQLLGSVEIQFHKRNASGRAALRLHDKPAAAAGAIIAHEAGLLEWRGFSEIEGDSAAGAAVPWPWSWNRDAVRGARQGAWARVSTAPKRRVRRLARAGG